MIEKTRSHGDEIDEVKQRRMKGNIIVSSISYEKGTKPCLIKTDEKLKAENKSLTEHVLSKFGVKLPVETYKPYTVYQLNGIRANPKIRLFS